MTADWSNRSDAVTTTTSRRLLLLLNRCNLDILALLSIESTSDWTRGNDDEGLSREQGDQWRSFLMATTTTYLSTSTTQRTEASEERPDRYSTSQNTDSRQTVRLRDFRAQMFTLLVSQPRRMVRHVAATLFPPRETSTTLFVAQYKRRGGFVVSRGATGPRRLAFVFRRSSFKLTLALQNVSIW